MSKYNGEQVLVVERAALDALGSFQGVSTEVERYLEPLLEGGKPFFMDRAAAEEDPTFKQLIPYCIFRYEDKLLHYRRGKSGGEARLHAKGSLGVGGHINPVDAENPEESTVYEAAVEREIREEIQIEGQVEDRIIGLINDDSNEVGQVHLGVVHLRTLTSDVIQANEDGLQDAALIPFAQLESDYAENLETWSQLVLPVVKQYL